MFWGFYERIAWFIPTSADNNEPTCGLQVEQRGWDNFNFATWYVIELFILRTELRSDSVHMLGTTGPRTRRPTSTSNCMSGPGISSCGQLLRRRRPDGDDHRGHTNELLVLLGRDAVGRG